MDNNCAVVLSSAKVSRFQVILGTPVIMLMVAFEWTGMTSY